MAFRVGQKVVCVDVDGLVECGAPLIKVGSVYTVSEFGRHPRNDLLGRNGPAVYLKEVKRPDGTPYGTFRFRPVVERKTDISIFTAMLNPSKEHVRA